jgi:hypothetical protein
MESVMPINPAEIKRAINLLTTVGEDDISGMEPEFFAAYARFSESYKRHVDREIAKSHAEEWARSQLTPCPHCGGTNMVICNPTVNYMSIYTYAGSNTATNSSSIHIEGDIFENIDYTDPAYSSFMSEVREKIPEYAFLIEPHLHCNDCDKSYPAAKKINSVLWTDVPCSTIVEWVNNKKPTEE